jgi:hypothetical protein
VRVVDQGYCDSNISNDPFRPNLFNY